MRYRVFHKALTHCLDTEKQNGGPARPMVPGLLRNGPFRRFSRDHPQSHKHRTNTSFVEHLPGIPPHQQAPATIHSAWRTDHWKHIRNPICHHPDSHLSLLSKLIRFEQTERTIYKQQISLAQISYFAS